MFLGIFFNIFFDKFNFCSCVLELNNFFFIVDNLLLDKFKSVKFGIVFKIYLLIRLIWLYDKFRFISLCNREFVLVL